MLPPMWSDRHSVAAADVGVGFDLENVNVLTSQVDKTGAPREITCDDDAEQDNRIPHNTPPS